MLNKITYIIYKLKEGKHEYKRINRKEIKSR